MWGLVDPNAATATAAGLPRTERGAAFVGERFAGFECSGRSPAGRWGWCSEARQSAPDRVVALKVIRAGEFADPGEVRRFRQEAEAAATLDHPNIVSVFEVGECRGVQFYAMRLVEGGSLAVRMAEWAVAKAPDPRGGAAAAEEGGRADGGGRAGGEPRPPAVHPAPRPEAREHPDRRGRRSRTSPTSASRGGSVKDSTLTRTGAILGTPSYMAPEQARGREDVTTEADVYGLGAVLYELLAGRPPFAGEDVLDTLYQVREREPAGVRHQCPWVDRDLETICLKCLEKRPEKRYSSAAALADDLDRWAAGESILARRAGPVERAAKWVRRNPAGAGLVVLGAVAAAAVIWGLTALSYNAELAEGKQRVEAANGELTEAKLGLEEANGKLAGLNGELTATNRRLDSANANLREVNGRLDLTNRDLRTVNGKLDEAIGRVTNERNEADRLRGVAEKQEVLARHLVYVAQFRAADRSWREGRLQLASEQLLRPTVRGLDFRRMAGLEWDLLGIGEVRVVEVGSWPSGLKVEERRPSVEVRNITLSPCGQWAAVRTRYDQISVWSVADGTEVPCQVFDGPGQQQVRARGAVWPAPAGEGTRPEVHSADVCRELQLGGPSALKIVTRNCGSVLPFNIDIPPLFAARLVGDTLVIATGGQEAPVALTVVALPPTVPVVVPATRGSGRSVKGLGFHPDGTRLACSTDAGVRILAVPDGKDLTPPALKLGGGNCRAKYSACGRYLAGFNYSTVFVHDAATVEQIMLCKPEGNLPAGSERVNDIAFQPGGLCSPSHVTPGGFTCGIWMPGGWSGSSISRRAHGHSAWSSAPTASSSRPAAGGPAARANGSLSRFGRPRRGCPSARYPT